MGPTGSRFLAIISAAAAIHAAGAATRPRYGGTLRMEIRERIEGFDTATPRLAGLVFEGLVRFDDQGRPQPALAVSWQSTGDGRRWEFRVRPGVRFHDGYPLTAAAVGGALGRLLSASAAVTAAGDVVAVESNVAGAPLSGLLAQLARPAAAITARGADGELVGTGPFRVTRFEPGRRVTLAAWDEHWGGRPFLDAVEIEMGRATRDQFLDLQLGKADLVELAPNEARAAAERGRRTWSSAPVELAALVFQGREEPKLREALALSIDRGAIHNVLLQRQGEITGALLPQWLSGYAFLFPTAVDVARARQLVPAGTHALSLGYDPAEPLDRIIAERIAVNARDAGINIQVTGQPRADVRLARARLGAMDAGRALEELATGLGLAETEASDAYRAERALVEGGRVIPLFYLPDVYGVGGNVKLWIEPGVSRMGELRLADIWLEKP